ncbi:hypothetical protein FVW20_00625 [Desulfovibrio oxamicus]|uniref:Uncharacterized protein n=1 Tax=Nitratidesulfovibrio oxamicus TaxID=32016 RepID=A0ABS0IZF5_9BACT|nr:hypothetical protein [Nitratidesulfovibrio oxamicus]MBG3875567.1 hypothetical protein [Nitratidesulfovibrio oxamicus]
MNADASRQATPRTAGTRRPSLFERSLVARCLGTELVTARLNEMWERALADGAQLYVNDGEGTACVFAPQGAGGLS